MIVRSVTAARALTLVGGLAFIGAGCANTNPDTQVLRAGEAYVLMETEQYSGNVGGQGIGSTLRLVDGCVGFGEPGHEVLAVFPPGTTVTGSDARVVIHVGDHKYRIGDAIVGGTRQGGDQGDGPRLSEFGDLAHQVPASCRNRRAVDIDPDS
ncbi:hypothetical protein GCM10027596_41220 [Nocardioides korecus]